MTKAIAVSYRAKLLGTGVNVSTSNIKVVGLKATYTYSSAHNFLDDVPSGDRVATSGNMASKTVTDGFFDAADTSIGSPAGGNTITQFWVYNDTPGTEATKDLLYYFDEDAAAAAISIATDGADITLVWHASGLYRV